MNEGIDYQGLGAVLTIVFGGLGTLLAAWIAFKSLPEVHTLVNKNFSEQKAAIEERDAKIAALLEQHGKEMAAMQAMMNAVAAERLADAKAAMPVTHGTAAPDVER